MPAGSHRLEKLLRRDRAVVLGGLAALTLLSWAYLVSAADGMVAGAGASGGAAVGMVMPQVQAWGALDLLLLFVMWAVMMVAMMVPSVAPLVLVFTRARRRRQEGGTGVAGSAAILLLGYLTVWAGFGLVATLAQWGLHRAALLSPMMESTSSLLGGGLLLAAGAFQFTPLKRACLVQCRSPVSFLASHWRPGARGTFVLGVKHGAYCVGCCWMLMALLFVAGVMNLLWVAVIAGFVLVEKVAPRGRLVGRVAGVALIVSGLALAGGSAAGF